MISAKGTRVAGTCEWIIHDAKYRAWLSDDPNGDSNDSDNTRLLWISGGPGKGKTMLSVFLTEKLGRHAECIDNAELIFFFCSAEDEKRNTAVAVLRGLVHQIIAKRPQLVKHALPYFETPERTQQTLSSLETLWLMFSKLVADTELGTTYCVLDGLDECDQTGLRALLPRLANVVSPRIPSPSATGLRLAIISRDMPRLQRCATVKLDPDYNEKVISDIELFVSVRLDELSIIEGFDEIRMAVQKTLRGRAEGTFLWVGFAMYELLQKQTCIEVLNALDNMPSGLPAIYSRMLLQIPAERRHTTFMILRCVTMALRPLLLEELATAVGVQPSSPLISVERAVRDQIALCGPFLKVQERTVSLVHQSARDYLLRKERDCNAVLDTFRIEPEEAHFWLAKRCLDCVMQSGLQRAPLELGDKSRYRESPLLRYAALHWPEHVERCSVLATELFNPSQNLFQQDSALRDHWWAAYNKAKRWFPQASLPLLHMMCALGIAQWVAAMTAKERPRLELSRDVNETDKSGMTALHHGAVKGNEAVIRLLVDSGADVNAKDNGGQTGLLLAAQKCNEAVVRLLVDRGADVKATDKTGMTALHWAAQKGSKVIVRLLVESGADVKATNNNRETALHFAASSSRGNEAVVQLLVDSGAVVDAKNNYGHAALHLAARFGNEAVVRLLVNKGADVNAKTRHHTVALHFAARRGNEALLRLLIERGADVKATTDLGETALHSVASSSRGSEAVARLLIDSGVDVNAKTKRSTAALHLATQRGNKALVQLLVSLGADVEAKDNKGKTVLHSAA